jgi:hypothetical protein
MCHAFVITFVLFAPASLTQNIVINVNGEAPLQRALLDIHASAITGANRSLLIPRVTAEEMNAIVTPETGLLVFNTTANGFRYFNGWAWMAVSGTAGGVHVDKRLCSAPASLTIPSQSDFDRRWTRATPLHWVCEIEAFKRELDALKVGGK